MRQIVRISVFILAVLLTINFFFNAVIANSYMLMILLIDLLMIFLLIFFPRKLCLTPKCIIILYLWIFVRQFYYSGFSFGQLPVLIYHCAAPIVTFTLISIISEDNRSFSIRFGKLAHHDFGKLDITYILIAAWCLIFVISLEHQRNLQNWGYANYIYLVYALFPLVFISEKKHLKWALFFLLVIATLVSKKRTAILLLVSYIAIIVFRAFSKKRIKKFQLVLVLFALFVVVILSYSTSFFEHISNTYLYRFDTSNDDNLNGRLLIWSYGLGRWWSGSFFSILFGSNITYISSGSNVGLTMHNDYIEMLTNYGVVGLVLTFVLILWLIKKAKQYKKNMQEDFYTVVLFLCANFMVLMLSSHIIIYPHIMSLCIIPIAFCNGEERSSI